MQQWRLHLAAKKLGSPLVPGNPMALWVCENLWYVALAVGAPALLSQGASSLLCVLNIEVRVTGVSVLTVMARRQVSDSRSLPST